MKKHILSLSLLIFVAVQVTTAQTYYISTIAGKGVDSSGYSGDNGPATSAKLYNPIHTVSDKLGNLYIADDGNNVVRKIDASGIITTFAGNGTKGNTGNGGQATAAELNSPTALAFDDTGNLYICCYMACVVRKVNTSGIISTVAGSGFPPGFSGDGGPATSAKLGFPRAVAIDDTGNIIIADQPNDCVRKVNKSGIINTIAGVGTVPGYTGDNGPASASKLNYPTQLAIDDSGNMYIADLQNNVIRKINNKGIITTFAGNGVAGESGNNVAATSAEMHNPTGVAVDKSGNVFIADAYSNQIRKVDKNGIITTIAGTGTPGHTGDGGPALQAEMNGPIGISVDTLGNIYVSEYSANADIRKLSPFCNVPLVLNSTLTPPICKGQSIRFTASGGTAYQWVGTANATDSITVAPQRDTTYDLHVINGSCSKDSIIVVNVNPVPSVDIEPQAASFCFGIGPKLTASGGSTYSWSPSTGLSATTGSAVHADPAGTTTYTVTAVSAAGCSATGTDVLIILPAPTISFSAVVNNKTVSFTSDSATGGVSSYTWDFGDSSDLGHSANAVHTYDSLGTYYVCLSVYNNSNCSYTICNYVNVGNTGVQTISAPSFQLYPNPAGGKLLVVSAGLLAGSIQITNLLGQTLISKAALPEATQTVIDVSSLTAGVYLLEIKSGQGMAVKKFVKE